MRTIISQMPNDRRRYFRGYNSVEIGYPWIALGAIIELEYTNMSSFKIIEVGAGGSTIFFARRCKSIKSFETDPRWVDKIKDKMPGNVELVCGTIQELHEIIKSEPNEYYDLGFVDHYPFRNRYFDRCATSNILVPKIKPGGYFVIDDYKVNGMNRFDYSKMDVFTYDLTVGNGEGSNKGTRICIKK